MKKLLLLLVLAAPIAAHAQRNNTFYVDQFEGSTVGDKVRKAQSECLDNVLIPCVIVWDPILAAYPVGTLPTKCTQCVWRDWTSYANQGGILNPRTPNWKWLELSPVPASAGSSNAKFNGIISCFENQASVNNNCVARLGWNILSGGAREDTGRPGLAIEFEDRYEATVGNFVNEFHLVQYPTNGSTRRFLTFFSPVDGSAGDQVQLSASQIQLSGANGVVHTYFGYGGGLEWYLGTTAGDNALVPAIRIDNNTALASSSTIKYQRGAALNSSYWQFAGTGLTVSADGGVGVNSNPVADVRLRMNTGADDGIDIAGASPPPNYYLRLRDGSTTFFQVKADGTTELGGGTLTFPLTAGLVRATGGSNVTLQSTGGNGRVILDTAGTGFVQSTGNTFFVASDFTTSGVGTALEAITGLTWTMPGSVALNMNFQCEITYHQNVAAVAVAFGIRDVTTAPTQINARGTMYTSATASTSGVLNGLASTTATAIVSATPSAITTDWVARISGLIEQPSGTASAIQIMVSTATATDTVTIKRGSYCRIY